MALCASCFQAAVKCVGTAMPSAFYEKQDGKNACKGLCWNCAGKDRLQSQHPGLQRQTCVLTPDAWTEYNACTLEQQLSALGPLTEALLGSYSLLAGQVKTVWGALTGEMLSHVTGCRRAGGR
jgi:hypothetical protein